MACMDGFGTHDGSAIRWNAGITINREKMEPRIVGHSPGADARRKRSRDISHNRIEEGALKKAGSELLGEC